MKHEKWLTCAAAAVLSLLLSYGTAGAMVTAFALTEVKMAALLFLCAAVSVLGAACFTVKKVFSPCISVSLCVEGVD